MKQVILLLIILVSIQNTNQIQFVVEGLRKDSCDSTKYKFSIDGTCKEDCSAFTDQFTFDLEISKKDKIKAECFPIQTLGVYKLSCSIDISAYPLNNVNVILPLKAPKVEKYTFTNWDKVIGANPGTSNVLTDIECVPTATNTFIPSSISIEDCSYLGKHPFTISGEWQDKNKNNYLSDYASTNIILDNDNSAKCYYRTSPIRFECEFKGNTPLKIKEQYVTILRQSFKINAYDSQKTLSECDDDDWDDLFANSMSLDLNKFLIIICLLLF